MDTLLLQIMPEIWKQDKDVELVISGYDNTSPQMAQYYQQMAMTIANYAKDGYKIKHAGHLTKEQLYKLYQESTALYILLCSMKLHV